MIRPWQIWCLYAGVVIVVFTLLARTTINIVEIDAARLEARRFEAIQENARLALWRIDTALAPLLAIENSRPPALYDDPLMFVDFVERLLPGEPGGQTGSGDQGEEFNVVESVLLHFEMAENGSVFSPWNGQFSAPQSEVDSVNVEGMISERVDAISAVIDTHEMGERFADNDGMRTFRTPGTWPENSSYQVAGDYGTDVPQKGKVQSSKNMVEQARRVDFRDQYLSNAYNEGNKLQAQQLASPPPPMNDAEQSQGVFSQGVVPPEYWTGTTLLGQAVAGEQGIMRPYWIGEELMLIRLVSDGGATRYQGAWLDWEFLKRELELMVKDLLPAAMILRSGANGNDLPESESEGLQVASLPMQLIPGGVVPGFVVEESAVPKLLLLTWVSAVLAVSFVALLLLGVISLSERRAAFVSSVSHELRTPLTTLRMYSEMLSEGMISDESKVQEYLSTIRGEADRLGHLVENVLSYARIERGRNGQQLEILEIPDLVARSTKRVDERTKSAGVEFRVELGESAEGGQVRCDPAATEQIIFNLVDNACKYGVTEDAHWVELRIERCGQRFYFDVCDGGEGVGKEARRYLFQPFGKSARQAAESAPGIGLGLELSRRLARAMRGELSLLENSAAPGASFRLELPAVAAHPD